MGLACYLYRILRLGSSEYSNRPTLGWAENEAFDIDKTRLLSCKLCYGDNSPEVALLRHFRDKVLLRIRFLSGIIDFYYIISPQRISRFGKSEMFRCMVKTALCPILKSVALFYGN